MNDYYVYAYIRVNNSIVSRAGTPYYIGKGREYRAWQHYTGIRTPKDKSRIILLETNITEIGALAIERRLIEWWGRKDLGTGILMNRTNGGDGVSGLKMSDETKKKMSESRKGRVGPMKGKIHSEESKQKIGRSGKDNAFFGKSHKEETKQKQSEVMTGRLVGELNPFFGKTHSPDAIEKIKKANIGKTHSEEAKRKIGEASRNRIRKPMSEETKRKILETKRLKKLDKYDKQDSL